MTDIIAKEAIKRTLRQHIICGGSFDSGQQDLGQWRLLYAGALWGTGAKAMNRGVFRKERPFQERHDCGDEPLTSL